MRARTASLGMNNLCEHESTQPRIMNERSFSQADRIAKIAGSAKEKRKWKSDYFMRIVTGSAECLVCKTWMCSVFSIFACPSGKLGGWTSPTRR
jgi:hypothetical protein